jgi:hypothetical protein
MRPGPSPLPFGQTKIPADGRRLVATVASPKIAFWRFALADTPVKSSAGVRDFDISPDGRDIGVEQVQDVSDIVLIELARR